jgi:PleD family two-component response regulator
MAPDPEKPPETIILCADELLYQAKATGRDRVAHEKCDNENIT